MNWKSLFASTHLALASRLHLALIGSVLLAVTAFKFLHLISVREMLLIVHFALAIVFIINTLTSSNRKL